MVPPVLCRLLNDQALSTPDFAPPAVSPPPATPDMVSLRDVLLFLLRGWAFYVVGGALGLLAAVGWLNLKQPTYEATMMVELLDSSVQQSSIMQQLADVPFLAGLGGSKGADPLARFELILESADLARLLQERHRIAAVLFSDQWDPTAGRWTKPDDFGKDTKSLIKKVLGLPVPETWVPPTYAEMGLVVAAKLEVAQAAGPLVRITFRHKDQAVAETLLAWVRAAADDVMRAQAFAKSEERVAYLTSRLDDTTVRDYRQVLLRMIANEEVSLMTASVDAPYAVAPFQEPSVSRYPSVDNAALILVGLTALGLVLGFVAAMLWHMVRVVRTPPQEETTS